MKLIKELSLSIMAMGVLVYIITILMFIGMFVSNVINAGVSS